MKRVGLVKNPSHYNQNIIRIKLGIAYWLQSLK